MKKKRLLVWSVVLVGVGFSVWWFFLRQEEKVDYEVLSPERSTITEIVDATGSIETLSYADVAFLLSGTVEKVYVVTGEEVKKDDVLAVLDGASYRASLAQAEASARIAEAEERFARRNWDDLKPEQREAKKLISEQARQNAAVASAQLEKIYLRAPMNGVISKIDIRPGEVALSGNSVARISHTEAGFQLSADIPEADIAKLQKGQEGIATFDAFGPREQYTLVLKEIEPEPISLQGVIYYPVHFEIQREEERFRSGMTADIEIRVAEKEDVLTLPFRAVYVNRDRSYIEVLSGDGSLVEKDVVIGLSNDEGDIEIISGVSEDDAVVVRARKEL
ncbi:MAG: efflux RND transporter periplasmic adaptor subunit [Candidatus Moranbacteria bacterium]|nr:efflux RND transporter periplasmic adaptor subunit [Candidatus Moranbacteria bacterium]